MEGFNPIKFTANFTEHYGVNISNCKFIDVEQIGNSSNYASLNIGFMTIKNCIFTTIANTNIIIYGTCNLFSMIGNVFEKNVSVYLHGNFNNFSNNLSDANIYLYEYGKGAITGNSANSISQSVSTTTYSKTGNYPSIS